MKKNLFLICSAFLLVSCSSDRAETAVPEASPVPSPEGTVNRYTYDGSPLSFLPEGNTAEYILEDGLSLVFSGKEEQQGYCREGSCIVYRTVTLNGSDVELFETMPLPVNEDYGRCILQKMDGLYFLSFANGAQWGDVNAVLFDRNGKVVNEYRDVNITMNTVDESAFLVTYVTEETLFSDSYEEKVYVRNGEVLREPFVLPLYRVREDAAAIQAQASKAIIGGIYGSPLDTLQATIYPQRCPFLNDMTENDIIAAGGEMLYCIVPTDPDASVEVVSYYNGNTPMLVYESKTGDPFLITGVMEDPYIEITITDSRGSFSFPLTSEQGNLDYGDGIVHDFSLDTPAVYNSPQIMLDALLAAAPDLKDYAPDPDSFTEQIVLDGETCYIAYFGTIQPNGWFTRERTFAVRADGSRIYEYNAVYDTWYYTDIG